MSRPRAFEDFKLEFRRLADRVPLLFASPRGAGRRPLVIFCHGADASKEKPLAAMTEFLRAGCAVLAFDAPGHGERRERGAGDRQERYALWYAWELPRFVRDFTAVIDWARARRDVDAGRIAALGYSMGGMNILAALTRERRLAAAVLLIATGDYLGLQRDRVERNRRVTRRRMDAALRRIAPWSVHTAPAAVAPLPLLFSAGALDETIRPAHVRRTAACLGRAFGPGFVSLKTYANVGHWASGRMHRDALRFLKEVFARRGQRRREARTRRGPEKTRRM